MNGAAAGRYNLTKTPATPLIRNVIEQGSVVVGEHYDSRRVEWARVNGTHPMFDPEYWHAVVRDKRTHLVGLILKDGNLVISQTCEDTAQLRQASGLGPAMDERHCTTFEIVTVDDPDSAEQQRLLRIDIGDERRDSVHNGHHLIASLKSIAVSGGLPVEVNLIRAPEQGEVVPFGLFIAEEIHRGALGDPSLTRDLFELEPLR